MIDGMLSVLRRALGNPPFEDYYNALLVHGDRTAPTAAEARKDYRARVQAAQRLRSFLP